MDKLLKNKVLLAAIVVVIILVAGVGGFLLLKKGSKSETAVPGDQTQNIKQVKPEDIGLKLSLKEDKKAVIMEVTKLDGIKSIEYEVDYNAANPGGAAASEDGDSSSGDVQRGVISSNPIEAAGQSEIKKEILLGTCSSGTCKYDVVTSDIQFVVKVNYADGTVGSVQDKISVK